jgi:hypothetical protein
MADAKISALSAQASAADADVIPIVKVGDNVTNKITKAAFLAGVAPEVRRVLAANGTISASALTTVTGLSVTVAAGGIYRLNAMLMLNKVGLSSPIRYGLFYPTMNSIRGRIHVATHQNVNTGFATVGGALCTFKNGSSGSVIVSTGSAPILSTVAIYDAVMNVNTGGSVKLGAGGAAGASASTTLAGSYIEVIRLN